MALGTCVSVALLVLLVTGASVSAAAMEVMAMAMTNSPFLRDPDTMERLQDAWGGGGGGGGGGKHPLEAAFESIARQSLDVSPTCILDIGRVLTMDELWKYSMADASVKVPEGLLVGEFTQLGNWDECVAVRDKPSSNSSLTLHGQMCLVGLRRQTEPGAQENPVAMQMMTLRLAVCVPSTCSAEDVRLLFNASLTSVSDFVSVHVGDGDCTTRDPLPFDAVDWTAVGVLTCLALLLVSCTAYDLVTPAPKKRALLTAFSVTSNGRKLLAAPRAAGDRTLSCLHGIRFLSMCWVVLGHRYYTQMTYPVINPGYYKEFMNDIWRVGISNATLSVDTFFVLSGLLVAYLFFRQPPDARRRINVPLFYLHRYIRLTPALALMVLLGASLVSRGGWGPLWPSLMEPLRENCRKSWWNVLLYVNNYVNPEASCIGQSWYLMVDMQLHWLSPLLILPLAWFPRIGMVILGALCLIGLIANFVISFVLKLPGQTFAEGDIDSLMHFFRYFYIPTYTRFVPYLEGFAIGYYLACLKESKAPRKTFPLPVTLCCWLLVAILLLVPLFTGHFFFFKPFPSNTATAFYNCFNRCVWSLGIVGVVYLCATGHGKPVNTFLSWTGFQILGRFSYCIYLVHMTVMGMEAASTHTNAYLSDGTILPAFASDLLVSLFCAAVLSLVCESPFLVLEKELLGRGKPPTDKTTNNPDIPAVSPVQKSV